MYLDYEHLNEMSDYDLLELARKVHGQIYKRITNKAEEILRLKSKVSTLENSPAKKMTKKEAVAAFEKFLEALRP